MTKTLTHKIIRNALIERKKSMHFMFLFAYRCGMMTMVLVDDNNKEELVIIFKRSFYVTFNFFSIFFIIINLMFSLVDIRRFFEAIQSVLLTRSSDMLMTQLIGFLFVCQINYANNFREMHPIHVLIGENLRVGISRVEDIK